MLTSENPNTQIVRMLLEKGRSWTQGSMGVTALRYASLGPNPVNRQLLLKAGAVDTRIAYPHFAVVQILRQWGAKR